MRKWEDLPEYMKCDEVKEYYDILSKKKLSLVMKRAFDIVVGTCVLVVTAIPMIVISVKIATESKGGVFYRQERVTTYGKKFRIHKFRTMVANADQIGSAVTVSGDNRITPTGAFLRKYRLDELPQIFDVLSGNMSFVGTRPEVTKYVKKYTKEMRATLLLPAGITSEASIQYKDEAELWEIILDEEHKTADVSPFPKSIIHFLDAMVNLNLENEKEIYKKLIDWINDNMTNGNIECVDHNSGNIQYIPNGMEMGAAIITGEYDIAQIMLKAGLGILGLLIIVFSTVTTTFLDAYSAGISSETVVSRWNGKHVAIVVTVIGTAAAIVYPMDNITDFLYLIGSVFAPMIAIQIADFFLLKQDKSSRAVYVPNMIIWVIGFVVYRILMNVDMPVGNTLPDMVITIILCLIAGKLIPEKNQKK